jgi:hypothetical protein
MSVVSKILTVGGALRASIGVSLGAAEGSPGLLAIGLGCMLFVLGVFKDSKSELQTPVFVGWWKRPVLVEWGERKKGMMDGNLAATAVEATTRILILEVAVILTALMAALATVIMVKVKRLKVSK